MISETQLMAVFERLGSIDANQGYTLVGLKDIKDTQAKIIERLEKIEKFNHGCIRNEFKDLKKTLEVPIFLLRKKYIASLVAIGFFVVTCFNGYMFYKEIKHSREEKNKIIEETKMPYTLKKNE